MAQQSLTPDQVHEEALRPGRMRKIVGPSSAAAHIWKAVIRICKVSFVITFLFSAIQWLHEAPVREMQANYSAWQLFNVAQDQPAYAGRNDALQTLNSEQCYPVLGGISPVFCSHHRVALTSLAAEYAFLEGINLSNATLEGADFAHACLKGAVLDGANLRGATFVSAHLSVGFGGGFSSGHPPCSISGEISKSGASMNGASLEKANLLAALLTGAKLRGATLIGANMEMTLLQKADMQNAVLTAADLGGAYLTQANLENAHLDRADLRGTDLRQADLLGASLVCVHNVTPDQVKAALNWQSAIYDESLAQTLGLAGGMQMTCSQF